MKSLSSLAARYGYCVSFCLLLTSAAGPPAAFAQTNAAAEAVRQRVEGLDRTGGGGREASPESAPRESAPTAEQPPAAPSAGGIDLSYVPSDAVAVAVLRPAKFMASPLGKLLPTEIISAYGVKYTGFDPANVNEVIAFFQIAGESPGYGIITRFNEPFKGSAIPAALRGAAKVGDLNGRKYLQASDPAGHSFFGPDNKTLIVGSDALVRNVVAAKDQPKAGPLIERMNSAPASCDAYLAVDVVSLRPMMGMAQMYAQQMPAEAQQFLEIPNLATAAELTFDVSAPSPMTLVMHANDDSSAERLEQLVQAGIEMQQAQLEAQAAGAADANDPIAKAKATYSKRVSVQWAPKREGTKLTFFQTEGSDAHERQLVLAATLGFMIGKASSAFEGGEQPRGEMHDAPFGDGGRAPQGAPNEHDRPADIRDTHSDGG